jgi:hypothetical protein
MSMVLSGEFAVQIPKGCLIFDAFHVKRLPRPGFTPAAKMPCQYYAGINSENLVHVVALANG